MEKTFKNQGFSLIELALGLTVVGLLMAPLIHNYNIYMARKIRLETLQYQKVEAALRKYAVKHGRYPLPAARDLGPNDPDFGWEYDLAGGPPPACAADMAQVCQTTGYRDADASGANDPVYIGDVPFATLGMPVRFIRDGYGGKFTYAISALLTSTATFQENRGVLRVIDGGGANLYGTAYNNGHYVVVSHGQDQRGAFSMAGGLIASCTGAGADTTNCNNDAEFTNNFTFNAGSGEWARQQSDLAGATHYDDYIGFDNTTTGDIWTKTATTPDIYKRNSGSIQIGWWSGVPVIPQDEIGVYVYGNVTADAIETRRLCAFGNCPNPGSTAGLALPAWAPDVFTPELVMGTPNPANADRAGGGIDCGDKALTGISNVDEECGFNGLPGLSIGSCPAGTGARGIDGAGQLICGTP